MDIPEIKDILCTLSDASYEYHKEVGMLARACISKTNEEVADRLDEVMAALDEQKIALHTLTTRLRGG